MGDKNRNNRNKMLAALLTSIALLALASLLLNNIDKTFEKTSSTQTEILPTPTQEENPLSISQEENPLSIPQEEQTPPSTPTPSPSPTQTPMLGGETYSYITQSSEPTSTSSDPSTFTPTYTPTPDPTPTYTPTPDPTPTYTPTPDPTPGPTATPNPTTIPEYPSIALPVAIVLGLIFVFSNLGRRR
ncbi:MAG: hypothetical protein QXJ68_01675 [Methanocellales archaeon]